MSAVATQRAPDGVRMLDALGVAVCLADGDELLYVNEAFERLTGWDAETTLGCRADDRPSSARSSGRAARW